MVTLSGSFLPAETQQLSVNIKCSEIILRPNQMCNLSSIMIRPDDDLENLKKKARLATILGCVQATFTDFNFLNRTWKKNTEEERLLGVSLTGLRDHPVLGHKSREAQIWLTTMKQMVVDTAKEWSDILEINMPTATCAVKPEGSTSQLTNTSSGLHPRYAPYYIRRVRVSVLDPICRYLVDLGVPNKPEVGQTQELCNTKVFEFPIKSPETSVMNEDVSALEQLEYWKMLQKSWCDAAKPSMTCYVKDEEWLEVGAWVYKNWSWVSGISFLPLDNAIYQLAPYEPIDEETFEKIVKDFPKVTDFADFIKYEQDDNTVGAQTLACTGGSCELV